MLGGIARGTSRGEKLLPVTSKIMHGWVILTNPQGLATPSVFRKFDEIFPEAPAVPASTQPILDAITAGKLTDLAAAFENDLWEPAALLRPDLAEIFAEIDGAGIGRILSGSGPSIAILCEISQVEKLQQHCVCVSRSSVCSQQWDRQLARILNRGPQILQFLPENIIRY
ncbi:hypothetical protein RQN30_05160 [Arcanobacterium hippocoleae]